MFHAKTPRSRKDALLRRRGTYFVQPGIAEPLKDLFHAKTPRSRKDAIVAPLPDIFSAPWRNLGVFA
ncbi:MAG: hypothetical protein WDO71_27815 [Bacteroidota bacterium]